HPIDIFGPCDETSSQGDLRLTRLPRDSLADCAHKLGDPLQCQAIFKVVTFQVSLQFVIVPRLPPTPENDALQTRGVRIGPFTAQEPADCLEAVRVYRKVYVRGDRRQEVE